MPLHTKIFIGLALGAVLGITANVIGARPVVDGKAHPSDLNANGLHDALDVALKIAEPVGKIFLRLMFMVVVPLVFSALALAVVEIGDVRHLGAVGLRTLLFTLLFSITAVLLGLLLVNVIQPGNRLSMEKKKQMQASYKQVDEASADPQQVKTQKIVSDAKKAKSLGDTLLDIIPENPLQEMVGSLDGSSKGNGMLAVMFFSLMFGAAIMASPEKTRTLVGWLEGLYHVSMTVIGWAMALAPLGAGCLVFVIAATLGLDVLVTLFWFVLTVVLGLAIQLLVTYPLAIHFFSRLTPRAFFRGVSDAMVTAFGTSSSNATLPTALRVAEENLKLPTRISNFVLTVGATGNQNGTALYEGVVVLFLAQLFDVPLTLPMQISVVLMSILAGVGTAGVPGGSLPLIAVLAASVGIPPAGIGVILGVDRLLDMCRTTLNVTGDLAVAACVAREETLAESVA
ncbi:MAG: dicarboxylate/amino acid:cation symporter [Planctomycetes bacterium]|nr:dicarboxylate/amino acid:cation symporter [Planctomycetota bacterium]